MDIIHLIILGIIQGLTEFLPISSSAHLILLPQLMDWQDQGLVYDVAAHVGSLTAVVIYFRKELNRIVSAWFKSLKTKQYSHDSQLFSLLAIATVPIAVGGYLLHDIAATYFRHPLVIAAASIFFGLLLWQSDLGAKRMQGKHMRDIDHITLKDALIIGMAQVLAIIPGTSRSGITMTAGLMLGLSRQGSARFSFLMAIPTVLLAGGYEALNLYKANINIDVSSFLLVILISAFSAWLAIHYFLKLLERTGMLPYVIYRVLLGIVLVFIFS